MKNNFNDNYNLLTLKFIENEILTDSLFFNKLDKYLNVFIDSKFKPKNLDIWINVFILGKDKTIDFLRDNSNYAIEIKKNNPFLFFVSSQYKDNVLRVLLNKNK